MPVSITELMQYLGGLLTPEVFSDFCPNGLQVAGVKTIERIVTGVSANQALTNAAIHANADALLVHHGYFWKGESPCVTGVHYERLSGLIKHDINLIAYHLPLDAHPKLGNNAQLAEVIGIKPTDAFYTAHGPALAQVGRLKTPLSGEDFVSHLANCLNRAPFYVPGCSRRIETIAWCTGAAQDVLLEAAHHSVDAFLTGEVSERTVAFAKELGIHFYAAGHHATERYGIFALGEHLKKTFHIEHQFIDIDNPI